MKLNKNIFLSFLAVTLLFASCGSTKHESKRKEKTTFVNTKTDITDGKIYSVLVFNELTEVSATFMKNNEKFDIPLSSCTYDRETTSLIVNKPKSIPYGTKDLVFTITGVPAYPAEFILHGGIYVRTMPGVFINGKKAVVGTDYTFDKKTHHLKFLAPVDSDKDSYEIIWLTKNGTSAMSNKTEPYASQFKKMEGEWYKGIR